MVRPAALQNTVTIMSNQSKGLLITALGVLLVTPDSLFVRLLLAEPMVIAFWRSVTSAGMVLCFLCATTGLRGFSDVFRSGWAGLSYIVLIGSTAPAFVLAVTHTSVANVVFIFASMPIFSALFSWITMKEQIDRRMVWTMVIVILGLGMIAYGSGENQIASWHGDLWALYVSIAYAAALTAARQARHISMVPAVPIGYCGAALLIAPWIDPLEPLVAQWPTFLMHGAFIGAATCLLTVGPRYISSPEVALLVLLESVLAPLLVWAVIGEHPGSWALAGGMVVIGTLIISNLLGLRPKRATRKIKVAR